MQRLTQQFYGEGGVGTMLRPEMLISSLSDPMNLHTLRSPLRVNVASHPIEVKVFFILNISQNAAFEVFELDPKIDRLRRLRDDGQ